MEFDARVTHCMKIARDCMELPGQVAECGVADGIVTFALDELVLKTDKTLYAFDTFEGLPYTESPVLYQGLFSDQHSVFWDNLISLDISSIVPIKGMIEDTLQQFADERFCFVWLDLDLEDSTRSAFEFFKTRMVEGGVIGFHDFDFELCPGIKKVVDEEVDYNVFEKVFLEDTSLFIRKRVTA